MLRCGGGGIFGYLFNMRVNLRTPTFGLEVLIFMNHNGSCLTWSRVNCAGWLQSWDRGPACSFHSPVQTAFGQEVGNFILWFLMKLFSSMLWSHFTGLRWALEFSGLGSGSRTYRIRDVTMVLSYVIADRQSWVTVFSPFGQIPWGRWRACVWLLAVRHLRDERRRNRRTTKGRKNQVECKRPFK